MRQFLDVVSSIPVSFESVPFARDEMWWRGNLMFFLFFLFFCISRGLYLNFELRLRTGKSSREALHTQTLSTQQQRLIGLLKQCAMLDTVVQTSDDSPKATGTAPCTSQHIEKPPCCFSKEGQSSPRNIDDGDRSFCVRCLVWRPKHEPAILAEDRRRSQTLPSIPSMSTTVFQMSWRSSYHVTYSVFHWLSAIGILFRASPLSLPVSLSSLKLQAAGMQKIKRIFRWMSFMPGLRSGNCHHCRRGSKQGAVVWMV